MNKWETHSCEVCVGTSRRKAKKNDDGEEKGVEVQLREA